jgi:Na+/phosphate symporter
MKVGTPGSMDDVDRNNLAVLAVFAGCLVAVVVGYILAWRAKATAYRKVGSAMTAVVAGFGGLVMSLWLMGAILPLPSPDGSPLWQTFLFVLVFSPLPLGAFYFCAKFTRETLRDN